MVKDKSRWIEIPYARVERGMNLWFRTHHGDHKHFAFQINNDGTISPEGRKDFVWALGEPM